jgi:hypothetical protein
MRVVMVVVIVVVFLQEVRVDVQLGVQVEAAQVEHLLQRHVAEVHRLLLGARGFMCFRRWISASVSSALATRSVLLMKIWSAKPTWRRASWRSLSCCGGVLGVHQRQDGVEQVALGDLVVHEEGLRHRAGSARPVVSITTRSKSSRPLRFLAASSLQRFAQVFADRAADAAVAHLDDLLLRLGHQDVAVDVLLAELVLDDGDLLAVGFGQDAFEQAWSCPSRESR